MKARRIAFTCVWIISITVTSCITVARDDLDYLGWRVAGPEEFDEMKRQLEAAGVEFRQCDAAECQERRVLDLIKFLDPGGNPTEIYHGPLIDYHKPFHPGRGMHGRFVTGDEGLGHLILRQTDVQKAYRFYTDVFGMRGSIEYHLQVPQAPGVHRQAGIHALQWPRSHGGLCGRGCTQAYQSPEV
jgi:2,3-dihydroxybiphenyl 1,2-dioxygenase